MMTVNISIHPISDDNPRPQMHSAQEEDEIVVTSDMAFEGATAINPLAWLNCPASAAHEVYIAMERERRAQMKREKLQERDR